MTEFSVFSAWVAAAAQLGAAAGLFVLAFVAARVKVRLLAVCAAATVVSTLPSAAGTPVLGGALSGAEPAMAAVAAATAAATAILAVWIAIERIVTPGEAGNQRIDALASARAYEARNLRLKNLVMKEHRKLETVNEMHRFFELATRNAQITVFYQDADLTYRWIVNPRSDLTPEGSVGRRDDEILSRDVSALVLGHKRRALATNSTQSFEVEMPGDGERAWYRIDVVPIDEGGGDPTGIVCTAIDITRSKRLDMMRTDLSRRLAETLQRFNLALRSERIMVFSQDLSLRYTWANSSETQAGSLIGRTDDDILPPADRDAIVSLKRGVIRTKEPVSAEVGVGEGAERRWYDLHVEPNLSPEGEVTGITCASIDITHRRRNEEQMRLVMRELTHRTKNLLTVVIAIARQTANQHDTVEAYVPALIARLRALSAAQDLIVADDWAGVDIADLVRVLVGQYLPPNSGRLNVGGPPLILSPEASQNLGLAIHELAANAAQYGALSNTGGTLSVNWRVVHANDGDQLSLTWRERGGPAVTHEPTTRGFGMTVIERNLARALDAQVDLAFMPEGLTAHIILPLRGVLPFASPDRVRIAEAS